MSNRYVIPDISQTLATRLLPTITLWNRLEGRPRKDDFDRALRAEVRDPLWMLTKQWQMGEFVGDDAGSPIAAKIHLASSRLNKYKAGDGAVVTFDNDTPLEGTVEQRPIPFVMNGQPASIDIRMAMGRYWVKLVKKEVADHTAFYRQHYSFEAPVDNSDPEKATIVAHPEAWQNLAAIAGRAVDGYKLYVHLKDGGQAADGLASSDSSDINLLGPTYVKWVENFFLQPDQPNENAWNPSRLEYQFACSTPVQGKEKVYKAEEYYSGKLDWYSFSIDDESTGLGTPSGVLPDNESVETRSFIPVPIGFHGMPNTRWWAFEDGKTYLGDIKPDTTDIAKLLFLEFSLVYGNDWFIIPQDLKAGTISSVRGMVVTNVFGEKTWIKPSGQGADDDWQRWSMFTVNKIGVDQTAADNSMMMLPTVPKVQEGKPIEKIAIVRDEVANMVWGIELDISLATGDHKKGSEAGRELYKYYADRVGTAPQEVPYVADIRYQLMNTVPENWIPFIPAHKNNDNRETQLQRAAMPRVIAGSTESPVRVRPRTVLLREGLDQQEKQAYFIHEEEVPRTGIHVTLAYQRTRWYRGKVFNWLGAAKTSGRGEGASGLAFDQVQSTK